MTKDLQISIIGAGKIGAHLAVRCKKTGIQVLQVYNRDVAKGKRLARKVGATCVADIKDMDTKTPNIIFLAVKDEAIGEVAQTLKSLNPVCLVVHVSGVHLLYDLAAILPRAGGFYPLMTFNSLATVPWRRIPIGISAIEKSDMALLQALAQRLAGGWFHLQDEQRAQLHIAAVLANNFTNQLLAASFRLLKDAHLPKQILLPLIQQTLLLAVKHDPTHVQTGPAVRNDTATLRKHMALLQESHPEYLELYAMFTSLIQKQKPDNHT